MHVNFNSTVHFIFGHAQENHNIFTHFEAERMLFKRMFDLEKKKEGGKQAQQNS